MPSARLPSPMLSRLPLPTLRSFGLLRRLTLSCALLLVSACAMLPPRPALPPTQAVAPDADAPIGKMADAALGADPRSAFLLLPVASAAFDTRIALIERASHSVDLQYYLFQGDDTGKFLMRALRNAAERGVRVRLLIDDLYTSGEDPLLQSLASFPNVEIRLFNPFPAGRNALWSRFLLSAADLGRVNHRMHNKLFIVDNEAAVTGGRNIADEYFMRSTTANFVDIDMFCAGPVVRGLSSAFDRYWNSAYAYPIGDIDASTSSRTALERRFDELTIYAVAPPPEDIPPTLRGFLDLPSQIRHGVLPPLIRANAEVVADPTAKAGGANMDSIDGTVTSKVLALIGTARRDVFMTTPYFVPGKRGLERLREVVGRGVQLTVVTNSLASTDEPLVHIGYTRYRKELLEAGVHIRELSPTLVGLRSRLGVFHGSLGALHAKLAVVDGRWVFIGSMNLDERSAFENTEMGLIIDSPELADMMASRADSGSSYTLRLSPEGQIQWVATIEGHQVVFDHEPEAGFWSHVEVDLLGPLVPEKDL